MNTYNESELIRNPDGSIFHLNHFPELRMGFMAPGQATKGNSVFSVSLW